MKKLTVLMVFFFTCSFIFAQSGTSDAVPQNPQSQETEESEELQNNVPLVQFRIFADFNVSPFYWEISKNLGGFGMNGSLMLGAVYKEKTFGLQADVNYNSFASLEKADSQKIDGAFSIFRFTAVSYIPLTKYMEIKAGIGGAFLSTAFRYQTERNIHQYYAGPSLSFDMFLRLPSFRYAELQFINRFDLMISENRNVHPYYYSGVRINFFPYIKWIKLYAEVGIMPWFYKDEQIKVNTAMFTYSVGASFDATIPSSFKRKKKAEHHVWLEDEFVSKMAVLPKIQKLPPILPMDKKTRLRYIEIIEELEAYYDNAKVLAFRNVLFKPDSAEFVDDNQVKILQEIADMLLQYDNIFINICGYTNDTGEDYLEKLLSEKRADIVVHFMEERGIPYEKMTIAGRGSAGLKTKAIDEINRRVELRILMKLED